VVNPLQKLVATNCGLDVSAYVHVATETPP